jgi:hypothetical protein
VSRRRTCRGDTIPHMHASGAMGHVINGPDELYFRPVIWIRDNGGRWHKAHTAVMSQKVIMTMRLRTPRLSLPGPPQRNNRHISYARGHTGHPGLMLLR